MGCGEGEERDYIQAASILQSDSLEFERRIDHTSKRPQASVYALKVLAQRNMAIKNLKFFKIHIFKTGNIIDTEL